MPVNWSLYPPGWKLFAASIKTTRARGRCECTGECGMHRPNPAPRRCTETHGTRARWFRGRVTLTTAHLCHCDPLCMNPAHVKALCQRCHLRLDRYKHARSRLATRHALHWTPARLPWHPRSGLPQITTPHQHPRARRVEPGAFVGLLASSPPAGRRFPPPGTRKFL